MRIIEIHIEVSDLDRAQAFYSALLPHTGVTRWSDGSAVAIVLEDGSALGLWKRGRVGLHGGRGANHLHFAFKIEPGEYDEYRQRLVDLGCKPIDHVWPNGERSVYTFDHDGHQLEFMTVDWIRGIRD